MIYPGHVENGAVVLDIPFALSEGTRVEGAVVESVEPARELKSVWDLADEIRASVPLEEWEKVPADSSINSDHYLYGAPKYQE